MPVIPSGYPTLDTALGIGGYPRGRIVELFGPDAGLNTKLALRAVAEAQRATSGAVHYVDARRTFDAAAASAIGINTLELLLVQPSDRVAALDMIETTVRSEAVGLVVVDDLRALMALGRSDESVPGHVELAGARIMSDALRRLTPMAFRSQCTVMFLHELAPSLDTTLAQREPATGSNALKFYTSVRCDVRRAAGGVRVKVVKNKEAAPFQEALLEES